MLMSLSDFRDRVTSRISTISVGTTLRHKPAALNRWINDALQQYDLIRTEHGHSQVTAREELQSTASTTVGDHGWPANEVLELPADFLELHRITRLNEDGTRGNSLDQYAHQQVSDVPEPGCPTHYRLTRVRDSETGALTPILLLLPPADDEYDFELVYTPAPPVLGESDSVDIYPGTADFVVCSAALSLLEYDGIQEPEVYKALVTRRDEAAQVLRRAHRQARGGVLRMNSRHALYGR